MRGVAAGVSMIAKQDSAGALCTPSANSAKRKLPPAKELFTAQ